MLYFGLIDKKKSTSDKNLPVISCPLCAKLGNYGMMISVRVCRLWASVPRAEMAKNDAFYWFPWHYPLITQLTFHKTNKQKTAADFKLDAAILVYYEI